MAWGPQDWPCHTSSVPQRALGAQFCRLTATQFSFWAKRNWKTHRAGGGLCPDRAKGALRGVCGPQCRGEASTQGRERKQNPACHPAARHPSVTPLSAGPAARGRCRQAGKDVCGQKGPVRSRSRPQSRGLGLAVPGPYTTSPKEESFTAAGWYFWYSRAVV